MLFAKEPVRCEVINDTNTELVNLYRVAQMKYPALKELIDATLHSREIHAHARQSDYDTLLERNLRINDEIHKARSNTSMP